MTGAIIPDFDCATRVARRHMTLNPDASGYRVFQYKQPGSGLTLFGALMQFNDGREHEVRYQSW